MITAQEKLPGENNREYSYRVLKEAIMSLQLEPGQLISELDLSRALEISRTPIREVMAKLREEHLVEVIPQVGTYVSRINPKLIEEATFVRFTLEKEILKSACKSFPKEKMADLKNNISVQEKLIGVKGSEEEFHKLDKEFHFILFQGINKENVWAAITRLSTHYNRIRLLSEMKHSFDNAIVQHKKIIDVIENKKIEEVDGLIYEHIVAPVKLWGKLYQDNSPNVHYFDLKSKELALMKNLKMS